VTPCEVCGIPLGRREPCPSPACPCYGLPPGPEADAAAERWRSRASVAQARTMAGTVALEHLERRAWLDYAEAAGDAFDVVIEPRYGEP
jgi:hypothetical protein